MGLGQGAGGAARRPPRLGLRRQHHPALGRQNRTGDARLEVDFAVFCLVAFGGKRLAAGDSGGRIHWLEIVD